MSLAAKTIKALWPNLTAKQSAALAARLEPLIGTSEDAARITAEWLAEKHPELVRSAPSIAQVQRHLEDDYKAKHEVDFVPAGEKINIGRTVATLDADARLDAVPYDAAQKLAADDAASAVAQLDARVPQSTEAADDEFLKRMGEDPYGILPSRRRMLLAARDAQPEAQRRDAGKVDELTLKSGGDPDNLSAVDRMTLARASASLK